MIKKKNPKSLNRFNSTDKIDNYNNGGKVEEKSGKYSESTTEQV